MANKVVDIVREKMINLIQEALNGDKVLPWKKPWVNGCRPMNYITRRYYRGLNTFILGGGEYITFTQIQKLREKNPDIKLKKGCKTEIVLFWNLLDREVENDNGETILKKFPLLRFYQVYNIQWVEGIESKFERFTHEESFEQAEELIQKYIEKTGVRLEITEGISRACYSPKFDYIQVPAKSQFKNLTEYYSTVFHEISHSSGAIGRLNRFTIGEGTTFGDERYSREELVAEMSSSMILGSLNIEGNNANEAKEAEENSVAYLTGWIKKIQDGGIQDILKASALAQKVCDYIMGNTFEAEEEDENVA